MQLVRTGRFKKAYGDLNEAERRQAQKALRLLVASVSHPSLQVKKIQGTNHIWEARVSLAIRLTFEIAEGRLILRNIGKHDATLKKP